MENEDQLWRQGGFRRFQIVRCVVTGHRGRFGVEVAIIDPKSSAPAFIDFVMLKDGVGHLTPEEFPPVGTVLEAVTLDFMPDGELRLSASPSSIARQREHDAES
ncbi:hypothetical protein ACIP98_28950 [Streptomyces sp. NPDC088354]|uniref:hypothetical protein n=1 Tax=Streptomyces sp. NPDC088354 TaxID=3365856 RepID=UPI00380731AB